MSKYITTQSAHCFYGNISNILNYHNIDISESELVLISDILNGEYHKNQFLKVTGVYSLYDMRICCYCNISAYSFMNIFLVL